MKKFMAEQQIEANNLMAD